MKQKTLREDAHSREAETCRKRPRSARECAKAHSFSLYRKDRRWRSVELKIARTKAGMTNKRLSV